MRISIHRSCFLPAHDKKISIIIFNNILAHLFVSSLKLLDELNIAMHEQSWTLLFTRYICILVSHHRYKYRIHIVWKSSFDNNRSSIYNGQLNTSLRCKQANFKGKPLFVCCAEQNVKISNKYILKLFTHFHEKYLQFKNSCQYIQGFSICHFNICQVFFNCSQSYLTSLLYSKPVRNCNLNINYAGLLYSIPWLTSRKDCQRLAHDVLNLCCNHHSATPPMKESSGCCTVITEKDKKLQISDAVTPCAVRGNKLKQNIH